MQLLTSNNVDWAAAKMLQDNGYRASEAMTIIRAFIDNGYFIAVDIENTNPRADPLLQKVSHMTWSRSFTNPVDETIRESADKLDTSELSQQYQEQFQLTIATAERLIATDEVPPGDLIITVGGGSQYQRPTDGGEELEGRFISVHIGGCPKYVAVAPITPDALGESHVFQSAGSSLD